MFEDKSLRFCNKKRALTLNDSTFTVRALFSFRDYSNSRAWCFSSGFYVDISPVFRHLFAYRLWNCLFFRTDGVKWESFFHSSRSKTLLFCYFIHQPGFPLVAFPPSLAKTKLQPYSFASCTMAFNSDPPTIHSAPPFCRLSMYGTLYF